MESVSQFLLTGTGHEGADPLVQKMLDAAGIASVQNPWFTRRELARALQGTARLIKREKLELWMSSYNIPDQPLPRPGKIRLIMAGNIPLVGFHDMICVILSGHILEMKTSSQDASLPQTIAEILSNSGLEPPIGVHQGNEKDFDAIIATGSNNSARYFEALADHKPAIIRKNRNSMAILTGKETREELDLLGKDIFSYFGLGCRNISFLMLPTGYDLNLMISAWDKYRHLTSHPKYSNNLTHHKALLSMKGLGFHDAGICLFNENAELASPLGVVHYKTYDNFHETISYAEAHRQALQCVVGGSEVQDRVNGAIGFGTTQMPEPWDYADGVDTIEFLQQLDLD